MVNEDEKNFIVSLNVNFDTAFGASAKTKSEAKTKAIKELKSSLKIAIENGNIANLSIEVDSVEED